MEGTQTASDWSAAPVEVLRRAFELQLNALDNCSAACSCSAWRKIVNSSSIGDLHLHATSNSPDDLWIGFLRSRASIDCLSLTRPAIWDDHQDSQWPTFKEGPRTSMFDSLTACKALFLSEHLARQTATTFPAQPQLQTLSLEWNFIPTLRNSISDPDCSELYNTMPPFLTHLTSLTELRVNMRNDVYGMMYPLLLLRLPSSLQSLSLEAFGSLIDEEQPPMYSMQLSPTDALTSLTALTHLALTKSCITIPGDSITCLSRLQSLNLSDSQVYVDGELEVSRLTNLTYLDLTQTICFWEDAWVEAMDTFEAWPSLKTLKLVGTNLVDRQTVLKAPGVSELELLYPLGEAMTVSEVADLTVHAHVNIVQDMVDEVPAIPLYGKPVVSLHIYQQAAAASAAGHDFWPMLEHYPNLQSLHIHNTVISAAAPELGSLFRHVGIAQLCKLELAGISCTSLDLRHLISLGELVLHRVDHKAPLRGLVMPATLQKLTFEGSSLFGVQSVVNHQSGTWLSIHVEHNLHDLPQLTELVLSPVRFSYLSADWQPSLPFFPVSLRCLAVTRWHFVDVDWSGLRVCKHLEHLTLPGGYKRSLELESYMSTARHLHVVDEDTTSAGGESAGAWQSEINQLWHGTRMLTLEDIPDWMGDPFALDEDDEDE